jgi:hypothetical protein
LRPSPIPGKINLLTTKVTKVHEGKQSLGVSLRTLDSVCSLRLKASDFIAVRMNEDSSASYNS